jgi:hypothetical protein
MRQGRRLGVGSGVWGGMAGAAGDRLPGRTAVATTYRCGVESSVTSPPRVLHLSLVVGAELVDRSGGKVGRVDDLIVRLGEEEYPPVTGLLAMVAGRQVFVPADEMEEIEHGRVTLRSVRMDLQPFAGFARMTNTGADTSSRGTTQSCSRCDRGFG